MSRDNRVARAGDLILDIAQRQADVAQLTGQLTQVQQLRAALGNRPGTVLDTRQRKQLVGQVGQAVRALGRRFQGRAPGLGFVGAQSQFQPRLECRQWRTQFMADSRDE